MKFCIEFGKPKPKQKPKPKLSERFFIEAYNGKAYCIVTERNMYDKGYTRSGWENGIKRWTLSRKEIKCRDRVLIEVKTGTSK